MTRHQFKAQVSRERLDTFLAKEAKESRSFIKKNIEAGNVTVNTLCMRKTNYKIRLGDTIILNLKSEPMPMTPKEGALNIVFEDDEVLVLNKKQGVVVHPGGGHKEDTLVHHLLYYFKNYEEFKNLSPERPGIVHRLDKGTSGILIIAKNRMSHENLSLQFKNRQVSKVYESIVWGKTKLIGKVEDSISRHPIHRKKMSTVGHRGKVALTEWKTTKKFNHFSFVELYPRTGRTHQLRVHMSKLGHPVVGDSLYGKKFVPSKWSTMSPLIKEALELSDYPYLHARRISFLHPKKMTLLKVEAERPYNFERLLMLMQRFDSRHE